jgi:hypothetical protein
MEPPPAQSRTRKKADRRIAYGERALDALARWDADLAEELAAPELGR